MMEFKNILCEIVGKTAWLTFNRPEVMNALNRETLSELESAFCFLENEEMVQVIILTGSGKSFVAGADLDMHKECSVLEGREVALYGQKIFSQIENLKKTVIAAINGYALGGGCELAMACDIRIASEKSKFSQPEVGLGIIPGWGGTQRMPRLIGKGRAKYYILTGEMMTADEAHRIGLVDKVVPALDLINSTQSLADIIIHQGPLAVQLAKMAINNGAKMDLDSGLSYESEIYTTSFASSDRIEGVNAFLEKRKPQFLGQ